MYYTIIMLATAALTYASVFEVNPDESIQAALNQSALNDTILLHDGDYVESVIVTEHAVVICSSYLFDGDTAHIANTTISPDPQTDDTMSCFVVISIREQPLRLIGLTLANGQGTVWDRIVQRYHAGGAVFANLSDVEFTNCVIRDSYSLYGGGVLVAGAQDGLSNDHVRLTDCRIEHCASGQWGGGIYADCCSLTVENCTFRYDTSLVDGGGIIALDCISNVLDSRFDSCKGGAGGIFMGGGRDRIDGCSFVGNGTAHVFFAAHLTLAEGFHVLERCYFGATTSLSKGINFVCDPGDTVIFRGNVVEQNIATAPFGTGNIVVAGAAGEIAYNIVRDNTTREAQIYAFQGTTIAIHHNVFARNVSDWHPSVLRTGPNPHQTFFENIITGNSGNTVAYVPSEPNFIDARNNYWGHPSGPYHPTLNSAGQGDTLLSDSVFFIPWLTEPPDTTFVSAGDRERRPDIAATWQLLDLYPNPFNSEIRIAIGGFTRDDFSLRLFDLLGRERATLHRGPLTGGRLSFTAPPALANGVYFVVASDRNFTETRKAILLK